MPLRHPITVATGSKLMRQFTSPLPSGEAVDKLIWDDTLN
jgi:hypothetical protein